MKKTVAILTIFFYFVFCIYSVKYVYADWASPVVKQVSKSFTYNGLQYTVKIADSITSAKATTLAKAVVNSQFSKVAIPLSWLGVIATVASVGYLVYDLTQQKQAIEAIPTPIPMTDGDNYFCGSKVRVFAFVKQNYCYFDPSDHQGLCNYYTGSYKRTGLQYDSSAQCKCDWPYSNCSKCYPFQNFEIYENGNYMGFVNTMYGLSRIECPDGAVVTGQKTEQQIKDWVDANRNSFDALSPQLSPTKPQDAVEISNTEYPDVTAQVDSAPQPSEESQPNPSEQPIPQPSDPESSYLNPSTPNSSDFDVSFDVPEKKDISTLLDRWLSAIPFLGLLSNLGISGSGSCSVSVQAPLSSGVISGVMNFCQYDDVFRVIGSFIFVFASIYSVYIIFKRSD